MSVYDELNDCIESAWSSDSCEYEVYSEMFDLIADAEYKYDNLKDENAKLCELILDMLVDEERGHNDDDTYYEHVRLAKELGIEV